MPSDTVQMTTKNLNMFLRRFEIIKLPKVQKTSTSSE